ncbi:MAG: hypothetical protein ACI38Y_00995 [Candidatus Methanomethylophilaceae archaeon]
MDSKLYSDMKRLVPIAAVIVVIGSATGYMWSQNGNSLDFSETDYKIVVSGSMAGEPRDQYDIRTIPVKSLVFIHKVPSDDAEGFYGSLEVGDVLTFDYVHPVSKENMVVTHRIISISENAGVYTYTCKGDSIADDPTNGSVQIVTSLSDDVIGKVVGVSPTLGSLVVFLSTGTGKLCLIIVPCLILILSEAGNIIRILRKGDEPTSAEDDTLEGSSAKCDGEDDEQVKLEFSSVVPKQDMTDDIFIRRP